MWPSRKPAANIARATPAKSLSWPSGSKIGPGDIRRRLALPGGVTLKPPNGGVSACSRGRSDLRSSGNSASAAREVTNFGSMPSRCFAQPGADFAIWRISGNRENSACSRSARLTVSYVSKNSVALISLARFDKAALSAPLDERRSLKIPSDFGPANAYPVNTTNSPIGIDMGVKIIRRNIACEVFALTGWPLSTPIKIAPSIRGGTTTRSQPNTLIPNPGFS